MTATNNDTRSEGGTWGQYIGGAWKVSSDTRPIRSPYHGRVVGRVSVGTTSDAHTAITLAHGSFAQTRRLSSFERRTILQTIHDRIAARHDEFAGGIVAESGKTIRDARTEVDRALLVFSLAADEARHFAGGAFMPLDLNAASRGRVGLTRRFPLGPVAALTPFNFALNLVAHKVAPALAAGCPVVLKPAEKTPLTALRLAQAIEGSGWPAGAFSVVTPPMPQEVGTLLAADPRLPVLSFTGSDRVGWALKSQANKKRVLLELGGNAAVIVHHDADVAYAADRCVGGAFANAGQVCISVQRIFVHERVWDDWLGRFLGGVRALRVGDPSDPATDMGPLISPTAAQNIVHTIDAAVAEGATALLHGRRQGDTNFVAPTVLTGTHPDRAVCRDEIFGPVVVVERYADFADALARVNDSRFGLQAGVFSRDVGRLFQAFETLEVGGVVANDVPQFRIDNMPYGGERDSGAGREGVRYAIEEMTTLRLLALNFPPDTP